ncbi:sigma-70 family RNA polymerase sigma factor [Synechocystis sp. LKSZ1]|uniref:sigma-70 family RNA polymerase sigma factor n=1 Tax=Synechocystis sp. LKSZ1 TaxID=3144951 RepID=UPI00336C1FD8
MEAMMSLGIAPASPTPMDLKPVNPRLAQHPLTTEATDVDIWQALQQDDPRSLQLLYERYGTLVYRLALRVLTHPQEAEDLTQDIFLTLWRTRTYNPNRGSLSSFLTTLTRSRAIDKLRGRTTRLKFLQRWQRTVTAESSALSPFEVASLSQRSEQVKQALAQLPDHQRQVLEMAYFDGLSQSEIAKQLAAPLGTVKSWSRQGLLSLRKQLQPFID